MSQNKFSGKIPFRKKGVYIQHGNVNPEALASWVPPGVTNETPISTTSRISTGLIDEDGSPLLPSDIAKSSPSRSKFVSTEGSQEFSGGAITVGRNNLDLPTNEQGQFPNGFEHTGFDGVFKTVVAGGKNVITALGSIANSNSQYVPWTPYGTVLTSTDSGFNGSAGIINVILPSSVVGIEASAFDTCGDLASINLPDSVETIGIAAFAYTALTDVTIPPKVTTLPDAVFGFVTPLASVNLNNVEFLGDSVFLSCSSLTTVDFGSRLTAIGEGCFASCSSIAFVDLPATLETLGDAAFDGCSSLATILLRARQAPDLPDAGDPFSGTVPATEIHVPEGATGYGTTWAGLTVVYDL